MSEKSKKTYNRNLFWEFFKIGIFTIGGGMAMIPQIQQVVVKDKGWLSEEEMVDCIAVSQSMPGVIAIPHTGWLEYSEEHGADMGGATNVLTGAAPTGQGTSGYNSAVVKVEKFAGDVVSDVEKPQIIIFEDGE